MEGRCRGGGWYKCGGGVEGEGGRCVFSHWDEIYLHAF